ncbi:MAG: helix-turn-helix domain-containing protein [Polyangiaceae bacterium]
MPDPRARFCVDPSGAIVLTSESAGRVLRELGIEGAADAEEVFGVSLDRLRDGARDGVRVPTLLGFVGVEALVDRRGGPASLLVSAEDEVLRGTRFGARSQTMDVVRGSDPSVAGAIDLAERYARTRLPILIVAERGAGGLRLARWLTTVGGPTKVAEVDGKQLSAPVDAHPALAPLLGADGGELLVRSIDEAPRAAQDDLPRALAGPLAHARLIAWAHSDPRAREGSTWSPQLVRLLRVSTVTLPPLRERADLVHVAETMLSALAPDRSLSAAARKVIERHAFPGNLTELEIVLQRARAHAGDRRVLEPEDFPAHVLQGERTADVSLHGVERAALEDALRAARGNLSAAAKRLGVARTTLYRMIDRHGDSALRALLADAASQRPRGRKP